MLTSMDCTELAAVVIETAGEDEATGCADVRGTLIGCCEGILVGEIEGDTVGRADGACDGTFE